MSTWLVTGGSGFLGRHLLDRLCAANPEGTRIFAMGRRRPEARSRFEFAEADLDDPAAVCRTIQAIRPRYVVHLAALTPPQPDPARYFGTNTRWTARILDALSALGAPVRLVIAGSAAELGPVPVECLPIGETTPCRPIDGYGLSKWAATRLALDAKPPVESVVARIFNPIGPGMSARQAFGRFARSLASDGPEPLRLRVGDLQAARDFIDVRDVAEALFALAQRGTAGSLYHVGTGRSHRVGEGLDVLIGLSGRAVAVESSGPGPGPMDSRADIRRIQHDTGWSPRIPFARSLADLWSETRSGPGRPGDSLRVA
jgi:GDP-4-dehydro-6-deoxy-D-mannose reductase